MITIKKGFSTEVTYYGSAHEQMARDIQTMYQSNIHENISLGESVLFYSGVYPSMPLLRCFPDGILEYSCCETIFVIVIKFPTKARKMPLTQLARSNESFYMEYANDEYILTEKHA